MEIKTPFFYSLLFLTLLACSSDEAKDTTVVEAPVQDTTMADTSKNDRVSFTLEETKMEDEVYTDFSITVNNKVKELGERLGKFHSVDATDAELQGLVAEDASYVYKSKYEGILNVIFLVENDSQVIVTEGIKDDSQQQMMYNDLLIMNKGK